MTEKRQKTGGRVRGTPNKRTQTVEEKLRALNCDPISGMATIATDENNPIELRAQMYRELARYIAPQRKAIEVETTTNVSVTLIDLVNQAMAKRAERLQQAKVIDHEN